MPKFRSKKERGDYLAAICSNEISRAEGGETDDIQANRELALKYYYAKPRGDEQKDRSQVISTDVADMTNATLAMLVPMLSTDAIIEFEPMGEDDERQAKAESDIVNQTIMEDNNGFIEIQESVKDALLLKNGCLKVAVDESTSTQRVDASDASEEELAMFLMSLPQNVTAEPRDDGNTVLLTTTTRKFVINSVPIENISYQAGYVGMFQDIRFFAERVRYTRSDLIEMGVPRKVVEAAQPHSDANTGTQRQRDQTFNERYIAETRDQDIIDVHECYLRIDLDDDGFSERYKVLVANKSMCLMYEPADLVPYSIGSPFLNPHRLTGESLFDHLRATQDTKTAMQRQLIDNITVINNGRYAYDPNQTAEEDVLTPKAGGGIRARNPAQSVVPIMVPDVTSGILAGLAYEDQRRSERGGASLDMLSADAQLVGETAHGIERQYASREALAAMMGKNLSETLIRNLYLLVHEYMRRYSNEPAQVRINGQYQQIDPTQWPQRTRVNVKTGMTPGQRGHLQQALMMHVQMQAQAMMQGLNGVLASPDTLYRTQIDWLRMAGVDNPERLVIDPQSPQAKQAMQAQQQSQQQAQQAQQQLMDRQFRIEEGKLQIQRENDRATIKHKYYDTDADIAMTEAKISGQGVIDLEKQRLSNEATTQASAGQGTASTTGAG